MPSANTTTNLIRKTTLTCAVAITSVVSNNLYASSFAHLTFERGGPNRSNSYTIRVPEPSNATPTILTIRPTLSFVQLAVSTGDSADWPNSVCTLSGRISLEPRNLAGITPITPPVENADFRFPRDTFSFTITPYLDDSGRVRFDTLSTSLDIEILADHETEDDEYFSVRFRDLTASCADEGVKVPSTDSHSATPVIYTEDELGYGMVVAISDTLNPEVEMDGLGGASLDGDVGARALSKAIPSHQQKLSEQFNSMRTLSLQTTATRTRALQAEINRARNSRGFNNNLQIRVGGVNLPQGLSAGDSTDDFGRWGFFVNGSVDIGSLNKNSTLKLDYDSSQLMAGADYLISKNLIMGSAISYSSVDAGTETSAKTDLTQGNLSLFASYYIADAFYLDAIVNAGANEIELKRSISHTDSTISSTQAVTHGNETSFALGTGYNLRKGGVNFRVFSFANYVDVNIKGYRENIIGTAAAANVDDINLQSLAVDFGFECSWAISTGTGVYTPQLSLAYEHQYADDAVDITGNFVGGLDNRDFYYQGADLDSEYLNAQLGVNGVFKNGFTSYLTYNTYINRDDLSSKLYSLGARWQF